MVKNVFQFTKAEYKKWSSSKNEQENISPFDAVVLDYQMPKKNGLEVAKEILALGS